MGVIVSRVDAPLVTGLVMNDMPNAIQHRVTHIDIGRCHVNPGAQRITAIGELPGLHPREQVEIFLDRTIPVRAVGARLGQATAILPCLLGAQTADIGLAAIDKLHRKIIEGIEII